MTKKTFNKLLKAWYFENARQLPWVGEKDAYLVWISEIILQQTRVEQGIKYYERFKKKFPTVKKLADAQQDSILKLWEGLGYYSRARNLHAAAQTIMKSYNGKFPETYDDIHKLKGVGDYTAAAIASYAFHQPFAVIDANVQRILARIFEIETPVQTRESKKIFNHLAQKLLDKKNPAQYNQAMMDFGATVCKPIAPACVTCPMKELCYAFQHNKTGTLPAKSKKIKKRKRFFHYIVLTCNKKNFIQKRTGKDIWKNMYEFPLLEANRNLSWEELKNSPWFRKKIGDTSLKPPKISRLYVQQLTHQTITARFFVADAHTLKSPESPYWHAVTQNKLKEYAFPGIIREYFKEEL